MPGQAGHDVFVIPDPDKFVIPDTDRESHSPFAGRRIIAIFAQ